MILDSLTSLAIKSISIGSAAMLAVGVAGIPTGESPTWWVLFVREFGSFGVLVAFSLLVILGLRAMVPKMFDLFVGTIDAFKQEMKEERLAREKSVNDFREMLSSHKSDLGGKLIEVRQAIEDGNDINQSLVSELQKRPCQCMKES